MSNRIPPAFGLVPAFRLRLQRTLVLAIAVAAALCLSVPAAAADDHNEEYRITLFPAHPILGSKEWLGIGYLGYVETPDKEAVTGYLGTGAIWRFKDWAEAWMIVIGTKTTSDQGPDTNELRPLLGLKVAHTTTGRITAFNLARLEYRILGEDGAPDREFFRFRNRVGAEFPLSAQPYAERTFYGLADLEGFYRFDRDLSDDFRLRTGVGFVVNPKVRAEFIYHMKLTRPDAGANFEWTDSIYRLNFKLSLRQGLVGHMAQFDLDGD